MQASRKKPGIRILVKSSDKAKVSKPIASNLQGGGGEDTQSESWVVRAAASLAHVRGFLHGNLLLFCETSEVSPVSREVFKLVGIDGDEHQHGVGYNKPPKKLQQTPPQGVIHLRLEYKRL